MLWDPDLFVLFSSVCLGNGWANFRDLHFYFGSLNLNNINATKFARQILKFHSYLTVRSREILLLSLIFARSYLRLSSKSKDLLWARAAASLWKLAESSEFAKVWPVSYLYMAILNFPINAAWIFWFSSAEILMSYLPICSSVWQLIFFPSSRWSWIWVP